jgi:beta-aspartyl-peptidase (threonine type)
MITRGLILLFASSLLCGGAVCAQPTKAPTPKQTQGRPARDPVYPRSEIRAIRTVLDEQVKAWNRGDLDAFMKGYWKSDQLTFFSGGTKLQGWQATMDRYIRSYKSEGREMGELRFVDLQIELLGSHAAVVRGGWELKMSKEQRGGLFTLIFRKTDQGWKIIHDHTGARGQ